MESGDFPKYLSCDFEQNSLMLFTLGLDSRWYVVRTNLESESLTLEFLYCIFCKNSSIAMKNNHAIIICVESVFIEDLIMAFV